MSESNGQNPSVRCIAYAEARWRIRNGDLLLWRPTNFADQFISHCDGQYSHIGSASWAGNVLESHEMLQWYGGRTCNLSALVRRWPGKIDVYRLGRVHGYVMSQAQRRRAGEDYGWQDLFGLALRRLTQDRIRMPWRKRLCNVDREHHMDLWERLYQTPLCSAAFCAEAVASDIRRGGVDLLPTLAAWEVSPNMIAAAAKYQFTLFYTETQAAEAACQFTSTKEDE
jgi:hypothetical protein